MRGVVFLCLLGVVLCNSDFLSRYKLEENPYAFPTAETFPKRFSRALLLDKLEGIGDQIDTLLVFGGRGSGKTTIRNHLLSTVNNSFAVYATNPRKWHSFFSTFNSVVRANISGQTSGSTCLEKTWSTADFADAIVSMALEQLQQKLTPQDARRLAKDPTHCAQLALLWTLLGPLDGLPLLKCPTFKTTLSNTLFSTSVFYGGTMLAGAASGAALASLVGHISPITGAALGSALSLGSASIFRKWSSSEQMQSALLQFGIRVVDVQHPVRLGVFAQAWASASHSALSLVPVSAVARLELLPEIVETLWPGLGKMTVFLDSVDEAAALYPDLCSDAMQRFSHAIVDAELLSLSTALHPVAWALFFPESRSALSLTGREAVVKGRLDRHVVIDLDWTESELFQLAAQRFRGFQTSDDAPQFEALFCTGELENAAKKLAVIKSPRQMITVMQEALMEVQKDGCLSSKTIEMIARKCAHDRTV